MRFILVVSDNEGTSLGGSIYTVEAPSELAAFDVVCEHHGADGDVIVLGVPDDVIAFANHAKTANPDYEVFDFDHGKPVEEPPK